MMILIFKGVRDEDGSSEIRIQLYVMEGELDELDDPGGDAAVGCLVRALLGPEAFDEPAKSPASPVAIRRQAARGIARECRVPGPVSGAARRAAREITRRELRVWRERHRRREQPQARPSSTNRRRQPE
jgi:hypothetical protein